MTIVLAAWVSYVKGRDLWKKENIEFAKIKAQQEAKQKTDKKEEPAKKVLELEDDKPLDENALYKIVNGKPVPIDKNEMATILELYQVAQIEISDEQNPSEVNNDDLPVYKTGLSKSNNKTGFKENEYGSLNNNPKRPDENKIDIGVDINREMNSNNPLNSDRQMLENVLVSSPDRKQRIDQPYGQEDQPVIAKKDTQDGKNMPRSNSG